MSSFQIIYPFTMPIMGDNVKDAIKNFAKFNRDMNISRMIIKDQTQHWDARINYYTNDIRNKVGINMFPISDGALPIASDVFIPQQIAEFSVPKYDIVQSNENKKVLTPFSPFGPYGPPAFAEIEVPKYDVVKSDEDAKIYSQLSPVSPTLTHLSPLSPMMPMNALNPTILKIPHLS